MDDINLNKEISKKTELGVDTKAVQYKKERD